MIPNECINFNAEIQFKEHFLEVQFPKNVMSLLSQNIFTFFFFLQVGQSITFPLV